MKKRYYIQPTTTKKLYWLVDSHGKQTRKLFYIHHHAVLTCQVMNTLYSDRVGLLSKPPESPNQLTIK